MMTPIIFLLVFSQVYRDDNYNFMYETERLKYVADECANTAMLYYDYSKYSLGEKHYVDSEGIKGIEDMLKKNLYLDNTLTPTSKSYWKDTIRYTAYFYDDSNRVRTYVDGVLTNSKPFTYNNIYREPITGIETLISTPTVIVVLNAGQAEFRQSFLSIQDSIRSSSYEYYTY